MTATALRPEKSTHADHPVFATADGASRWVVRWMGCASALLLTAWVAAVMVGALGTASLAPLGRHLLSAQPALHVLDARRMGHALLVERERADDRKTHARRT
jgi:hypothetical protein